ncbi:cyclodeaminase/cyclohydrolase family protein [Propionispora hippei]|uniref:Formiminotetrahydrofolate cyclodeaminase n=1 Tax=Propionispora hippei DSM 15287 TaxID=1123003 RepID=A0A1M6F4U1_9FIRM|nr:cyclodeaminase/cyclohydrolase family protein [Propionispora hippei]SHI92691.1 Formiminotetrahydrofolate cyclodeaminase [Propionispora hippei DSM 15287]
MITTLSIRDYAQSMALRQPPPGGGSTAALSGLLGVSLLALLINLVLPGAAAALDEPQQQLAALRERLLSLAEEDAVILADVLAAFQSGASAVREDDRAQAVLLQAACVPLSIAENCLQALQVGERVLAALPPHAQGDLLTAALACQTGIKGALLSVAANLPWLADAGQVQKLKARLQEVKESQARLVAGLTDSIYAVQPYQILR